MRFFSICAFAASVALAGAFAPVHGQKAPRSVLSPERVTLLTDGIADPGSPGVQLVNDLASRLGQQGLRVLPIAGEGGVGNIRDLLQLKGVDLAILNSDILSYLDATGEFPDARRRIRFVTHLGDQPVYLLGRSNIASINDLRGRRVAALTPPGIAPVTAKTLFGLLKVDAELLPVTTAQLAGEQSLNSIDGVILSAGDVARLGPLAERLAGFHLVPVETTTALARTYTPIQIAPNEVPGIIRGNGPTAGIAYATVLAVFDWTPQHSRYANVFGFVKGFFQALPTLRTMAYAPLWRQANIRTEIPGWQRYAAADPAKFLSEAQLASLSTVDRSRPAQVTATSAIAVPDTRRPQPGTLSIVAINRPPLADEAERDGGLIPALLAAGLKAIDPDVARRPDFKWVKGDAISLQLLTNETAADILLPWDKADCDKPSELTQTQAMLCDRATLSEPIMQVVIGLFTVAESEFKFLNDASVAGRSICLPYDRDIADLTATGRNWIAEKKITLIRQPTMLDCVGLVQRKEADAFVATDLEGQNVLKRLGLSKLFTMAERPLGTRTIHAAVWKSHPQAAELLDKVNKAIRQIKDNGAHASLVNRYLMSIWNTNVGVR